MWESNLLEVTSSFSAVIGQKIEDQKHKIIKEDNILLNTKLNKMLRLVHSIADAKLNT